jgi:hypothetical protein
MSSTHTVRSGIASREIGEPCGVPDTVLVTTPFSNTPTRSHARSFNSSRSDTLLATRAINTS